MARTKQQELDRLLIAFAEIPWQRKAKDHQLLSFVLPGYQAGLIKKVGSGWMVSDEGVERLRVLGYDYDEDEEQPGASSKRYPQLGYKVRNLTSQDIEDKLQRELKALEDEVPDENIAPRLSDEDY